MIKAVLFDLWNTLAYNKRQHNPLYELERILGLRKNEYKVIEKGIMTRRFDSIHDSIRNLCRVSGIRPTRVIAGRILRLYRRVGDSMEFFPDVIPNLSRFRRRYKTALISNVSQFSVDALFRNGVDRHFDDISLSYKTGVLKPDSRAFLDVLERLGVQPEEAIMVGDNFFDDVLGAESVGIKGILIKRDIDRYMPSWRETHIHENMISTLDELDRFLN